MAHAANNFPGQGRPGLNFLFPHMKSTFTVYGWWKISSWYWIRDFVHIFVNSIYSVGTCLFVKCASSSSILQCSIVQKCSFISLSPLSFCINDLEALNFSFSLCFCVQFDIQ